MELKQRTVHEGEPTHVMTTLMQDSLVFYDLNISCRTPTTNSGMQEDS